VTELREWAFGIPDDQSGVVDQVWTAYLLFYRKSDISGSGYLCTPHLEDRINRQNEVSWASQIFQSRNFVGFVRDLMLINPQNDHAIQIGLIVFFRIVVVVEDLLGDWVTLCMDHLITSESRSRLFFGFLNDEIGSNLGQIMTLSDQIASQLAILLEYVYDTIKDSIEPTTVILLGLNFSPNRRIIVFLFNLIVSALKKLSVDWAECEETVGMMAQYLILDIPKDSYKLIAKQFSTAFDLVISLLDKYNFSTPALPFLDAQIQSRLAGIVKRHDAFQKFVQKVRIADKPPPVVVERPEESSAGEPEVLPNFPQMIFSEDESDRRESAHLALKLIGTPEKSYVEYLKNGLSIPGSRPPDWPEESSGSLYFVGLVPEFCRLIRKRKTAAVCSEFVDVLLALCFTAPGALSIHLESIVKAYFASKDVRLLTAIQRILAFDPELVDHFSEADARRIVGLEIATPEAIQLLWAFRRFAADSAMSRVCLVQIMAGEFDGDGQPLLDLIADGFVPADIELPQAATDFVQLRIANVLWAAWPDRRDDLRELMESGLRMIRNSRLFLTTPTYQETMKILNSEGIEAD
jgi:hypothetical protein